MGRLAETGDWEILNCPAIATDHQLLSLGGDVTWERNIGDLLHPDRIGHKELERIKAELGPTAYEAQYQQSPVVPGGNLVKLEWFRRCCQTNANSSQFPGIGNLLGCADAAPLGKSGGAVELEI